MNQERGWGSLGNKSPEALLFSLSLLLWEPETSCLYPRGLGLQQKGQALKAHQVHLIVLSRVSLKRKLAPKEITSRVNPCWSDVGKCWKIPCQVRQNNTPSHSSNSFMFNTQWVWKLENVHSLKSYSMCWICVHTNLGIQTPRTLLSCHLEPLFPCCFKYSLILKTILLR